MRSALGVGSTCGLADVGAAEASAQIKAVAMAIVTADSAAAARPEDRPDDRPAPRPVRREVRTDGDAAALGVADMAGTLNADQVITKR